MQASQSATSTPPVFAHKRWCAAFGGWISGSKQHEVEAIELLSMRSMQQRLHRLYAHVSHARVPSFLGECDECCRPIPAIALSMH